MEQKISPSADIAIQDAICALDALQTMLDACADTETKPINLYGLACLVNGVKNQLIKANDGITPA